MIAAVPRPPVDWFAISPSLILLLAAGACLMVAVLVPDTARRATAATITAGGFVGAFVAAILLYDRTPVGLSVYADTVRRDRFFALAAIILAAVGLVAVLVSYTEHRHGHVAEYYALLATAAAGMMFLTQANSLMTLFLGLEWFSISLYILCAIDYRRERSLEAGLKYLVIGGFGSAVLLFGSALVYGATGKLTFDGIAEAVTAGGLQHDALLLTGLAMIIVGLGFKASAAPFHMWTPDVYEGAPTSVTAFMAAATKVAALAAHPADPRHGVPAGGRPLDDRRRGDRRLLARARQLRRARPEEPEAAARVLVDLERRLHADRRLREQRAGRAGAPLLPDSLRGGLDRGLRRDRRPRARARPRRDRRRPGRNGLGAAAARRGDVDVHALASPACRRPAASSPSSTSSRLRTTAAGSGS